MRRTKVFLAGAAAVAMLTACSGGGGGAAGQSGGTGGGGAAPPPTKDIGTLVKTISDKTRQERTVQADLQIGSSSGKGKVTGHGKLDLTKPASDFSLDAGPEGTVRTILVDGVTYLKAKSLPVAGHKPWAKIDKNSNNPLAKFIGSVGDQSQQADPGQTINQMKAGGKITKTGRATLDGQQTTMYVISVDMQKVADQQPNPMLKQIMEAAVRSGVKRFPITIWLNGKELPVQMKVDSPVPSAGQGGQQQSSVSTLVKYHDWGAPVTIAAPPAGQVGELEMPQLPQGLGQQPGGH
jgi:hypothetical protein